MYDEMEIYRETSLRASLTLDPESIGQTLFILAKEVRGLFLSLAFLFGERGAGGVGPAPGLFKTSKWNLGRCFVAFTRDSRVLWVGFFVAF